MFLLPAGPAVAAESGLLRVAHLSPDSPAVDVSLARVGSADPPRIVPGLAYGDVSPYLELPPGSYAVSVRGAGEDPATPPRLSATVDLVPGAVRTVAGTGAFADLSLAALDDDLAAPAPGSARVRVLAAATGASRADVDVVGGPRLASDLGFGQAAGYVDVPAGTARLRLAPGEGRATTATVALDAGSVYSLLLLDDGGGLTTRLVRDAAGPAAVPAGAVDAGVAPARPDRLADLVAAVARTTTPAAPVRVQVPAIAVDAPVAGTAADATGTLAAPDDPGTVGWLVAGPVPGATGPAVLTGHVSYRGPAVFGRLAELRPGDAVLVSRADGSTARFVVTRVSSYAKLAFPTAEVYGPTPDEQLRLITCGGALDARQHSYADDVVVYAQGT